MVFERKFSTRKILSLKFKFYLLPGILLKILRICPKILECRNSHKSCFNN
ncbi:hypothetical protein LEP1GSC125_2993 [Leptospira mayottensis 200901122]|uniref:Uncharacterized protein n=1 Tax=Leptospira mayottensis 200901122 TaxID=1193010 RepID=A0AA87SWY7_9LEPT|nr:hypothetical protein LEP1GSC125_2993 [Leptospira mayottensis 200901122]